jgi:hypothetical protein
MRARLEHKPGRFSKRTALSIKGVFVLAVPAAMVVGVLAKTPARHAVFLRHDRLQLGSAAELAEWLAPALVFAAAGIVAAVQLCAAGRASSGRLNAASCPRREDYADAVLATSERNVFAVPLHGGRDGSFSARSAWCSCSGVTAWGFDALSSSQSRPYARSAWSGDVFSAFCPA